MDRTTEQQQLSHEVSESSETKKDSFMFVPQYEDTTPIQIGEILNDTYQIIRVIAQGGMGIVYEGFDLFLHKKVAIKVLVTDIDTEEYEKELKLFQTEINLCGNLQHPNIIQIYYSGIHHRLPYLVMEYIDGIPINEYVMKQRRCNWENRVKLICQVANGLAYIHKNNILHRDIKPSNILVKADGTPILIDFGISIKKNLANIETNDGELSGTIRYMAPEQVAGQYDQINECSDIYSLGLILYEILTKRPAYTGSPNEVIGQIFNSLLLPPSEVNVNIPEALSNITMKAIAKNTKERYSTAEEFIEDLELYLKNASNKKIINEMPLWQKAYYTLKPNKVIAVALILIAFLFMTTSNLNAFDNINKSIKNANYSIRKFISNPSLTLESIGLLKRKEIESDKKLEITKSDYITKPNNIAKLNTIAKFRKANLPLKNTIEPKIDSNANDTKDSQCTLEELAQNDTQDIASQEKSNNIFVETNQTNQSNQTEQLSQTNSNESTKENNHNTILNYTLSQNKTETKLASNSSKKSKSFKKQYNKVQEPICANVEKSEPKSEPEKKYKQKHIPEPFQELSIKEKILATKKFTAGIDYSLIRNKALETVQCVEYEVFVHNETGMEFILVEEHNQIVLDKQNGNFFNIQVDHTNVDEPDRQVNNNFSTMELKKVKMFAFLIARNQCTQEIWKKVMGTEPWKNLGAEEDSEAPAIGMTLDECKEFCSKTGLSVPYMDQLIYAQCFPFGCLENLQTRENFEFSPANSPICNDLGLYNTQHPVFEWCQDYSLSLTPEELVQLEQSYQEDVLINNDINNDFRSYQDNMATYKKLLEIRNNRFNFLSERECGITVGFRPIFIIPQE